jgi:methyltransferase (TIGR00027 family)
MEAVLRGIQQYVVLGAGFDTFAYRTNLSQLRVFEVDHPASQKRKRMRLAHSRIPATAFVTYVPMDLERSPLLEKLGASSFELLKPAFISCLGVMIYLRPEAVLGLLREVKRRFAPGSEIVFDYAGPVSELQPSSQAAFDRMALRSRAAGEGFRSAFVPGELMRELSALGFGGVTDLNCRDLNAKYFCGRMDNFSLDGLGHIIRMYV